VFARNLHQLDPFLRWWLHAHRCPEAVQHCLRQLLSCLRVLLRYSVVLMCWSELLLTC